MADVFTTAGLALLASRRQMGLPVVVDKVSIGSLAASARYDAAATATALKDATPLDITGSGITFRVNGGLVIYSVAVPAQTTAVAISEVGFWVGSVLLAISASASGDIGQFTANQGGLLSFVFTISNAGVPANPVVQFGNMPLATQAEAEAGTANDKLMTPLRTAEAIAALAVGQSRRLVFTANGTWTKLAGLQFVYVRAWGGGESGEFRSSPTNNRTRAEGGRGGGYADGWFAAADLGATEAVTVPGAIAAPTHFVSQILPHPNEGMRNGFGRTASFGSHVVSKMARTDLANHEQGLFYGGSVEIPTLSLSTAGSLAMDMALNNGVWGAGSGGWIWAILSPSMGPYTLYPPGSSVYGGAGGAGALSIAPAANNVHGSDGNAPGGGGGSTLYVGTNNQRRAATNRGGAGARGEVQVYEFYGRG